MAAHRKTPPATLTHAKVIALKTAPLHVAFPPAPRVELSPPRIIVGLPLAKLYSHR